MNKFFTSATVFTLIIISVSCTLKPEINWKIAENPLLTRWAERVDPLYPWPEYPRPDLVRNRWLNLNGLWQYSITPLNAKPEKWDGEILVPYPVESALSGVRKKITENDNLWYRRTFRIPNPWRNKLILLNFEACDWETTVWIDGKEAGTHRGGYDPFTFDITPLLGDPKEHELLIKVWDPTDRGTQPRGKQVLNPGGIWYTPTTGIWQTVWIEPVDKSYISSFRIVANPDNGTVTFKAEVVNCADCNLKLTVRSEGRIAATASGTAGELISLKIDNPALWSPGKPFLYDLSAELNNGNGVTDNVDSYFGFRKTGIGKTEDGFTRILFNNEFIWQNGPLDQGFWPDGIYTPPTETAMKYDLEQLQKMGFNMLRKHVKVENRRFYYICDLMGLLVWQDMPSGDMFISGTMPDISRSKEASDQFEFELKRMIETKFNHPSIIMWIPFNEGWGQFDTERITKLISDYDPTRLVNSASGWTDRGTGKIKDVHHYPDPVVPKPEQDRAIVLGEFGGLGFPVQGHTWEKKAWGYRNMADTLQLLEKYESYYDQIHKFVRENGLSATVYTQTTDVETETNGLMTYDRRINKMGVKNVYNANADMIPPTLLPPVTIFTDRFTGELKNSKPDGRIYYTTDGSEPHEKSKLYTEPFTLTQSAIIKAFTVWKEGKSRIISYNIEKISPAQD
ncbi:MAG: chitobiase/beta-hexosaminidase C-terminal domain-containing protein [Bacteroidales bacterium]